MQPNIVHLHEYGKSPEPLKIKIERNTKVSIGRYRLQAHLSRRYLLGIREANLALKAEYGGRAGNGNSYI